MADRPLFFRLIWSNLIRFDPTCSVLIQFNPIWSDLNQSNKTVTVFFKMADRPLFIRLSMPSGLEDSLEGLAREVLRAQPKDMLEFSAQYFEGLLRTRNKGMYTEGIGESWAVRLDNYLVRVLFWQEVIYQFLLCEILNLYDGSDYYQIEPKVTILNTD